MGQASARPSEPVRKGRIVQHQSGPVVTVGETMAAFVRRGSHYDMVPAGAESNVAVGVAQMGTGARWVSRLGCDELGRAVAAYVGERGVEVQLEWDDERPTATCVKEVSPAGTRMRYYRSGSAASRLAPEHLHGQRDAAWLHVTGVTPALSRSARDLTEAVVEGTVVGPRSSFDVNLRPVLWPDAAVATETLVSLARRAQLVFLGEDEALSLLGTTEMDRVREALVTAEDHEVVLKRGAGAATLLTASGAVTEPATVVDVLDVVGAGDAFAAGFLAAGSWGADGAGRLRAGHFLAARVVGVSSDCGPAPEKSVLRRLREQIGAQSPERTVAP